jgi:hypothetical protein
MCFRQVIGTPVGGTTGNLLVVTHHSYPIDWTMHCLGRILAWYGSPKEVYTETEE